MTTTVCHGVRDPEKRVTSFVDSSQRFVCKCYNKAALKCDPLGEINGWIYWVELNRFTDRRRILYYYYTRIFRPYGPYNPSPCRELLGFAQPLHSGDNLSLYSL